MINISKKTINRFHYLIDNKNLSFDECWNFKSINEVFPYILNDKYKTISFKGFSYLIYISCDIITTYKGRIIQMCDNIKCCNPFHLQPCLLAKSKESKIFEDILSRMRNPNNLFYKDYGGRQLKLDDRWNPDLHLRGVARLNFFNDIHELGYNPNLTIDRIDNNIGYIKSNIRFVDWSIQGQNRRTTKLTNENVKFIRENSELYTLEYFSKKFNIHINYVRDIINRKYWKNI